MRNNSALPVFWMKVLRELFQWGIFHLDGVFFFQRDDMNLEDTFQSYLWFAIHYFKHFSSTSLLGFESTYHFKKLIFDSGSSHSPHILAVYALKISNIGYVLSQRIWLWFHKYGVLGKLNKNEKLTDKANFHYMKTRQSLMNLYSKCKILINFKAIKNELYIKAALMKL